MLRCPACGGRRRLIALITADPPAREHGPRAAFDAPAPRPGTRRRMNLYRRERANRGSLAWRPVRQSSFRVPERFGGLESEGGR